MRERIRLAGFLCLAAVIVACDAEQPQQIGTQTAQVSFRASASVPLFDVWERYVDANGDGLPDEFDELGNPIVPPVQVQCVRSYSSQNGSALFGSATSVPWRHSVEILVLRNGETEPARLTTEAALGAEFNLAPYDSNVRSDQAAVPCSPPEVCTPIGRLSAAHRIVMESAYEDLQRPLTINTIPPQTILGQFRCPGNASLGEPTLGGTQESKDSPPFELSMNQGDTVIVRARKAELAGGGLELASQPILLGSITVNGRTVVTQGTSVSTTDVGAGVSFSFTVR